MSGSIKSIHSTSFFSVIQTLQVYYSLKKVYSFFHVFMISYIAVKLIGLLQKNKKQQRDDIISFFYNPFKVRVGVNAFLELDGTTLE